MRRLLWLIIFCGAYYWIVTSGNDQMILEKGKWAYKALVAWFEDAEIDYQINQEKDSKKQRSRRWD